MCAQPSYTFFRPLDPLPASYSRRRSHDYLPPTIAFHSKTAHRTQNPVEITPTGCRFRSVTLLSPSTTERSNKFIRVFPVWVLCCRTVITSQQQSIQLEDERRGRGHHQWQFFLCRRQLDIGLVIRWQFECHQRDDSEHRMERVGRPALDAGATAPAAAGR